MECLKKFEDILENGSSSSQQMLRMLLFASQTKVIQKILPSIKIIIDNIFQIAIKCYPHQHLHTYYVLQARKRTVTIGRANRGELLQFELIGGHEKSYGVFVDTVSILSFC